MTTAAAILAAVGTPPPLPPAPPELPAEFWATPQLRHIQQAAHSQGLPATPVLLLTLASVAAGTDHRVQLPSRPNYGALNLTVAAAEASGGNKGSAMRCASMLAPLPTGVPCMCGDHDGPEGDYLVVPVGSAQGLVKSYMQPFSVPGAGRSNRRQVLKQDRRHVLISIDEGTALDVVSANAASNPLPTLATLWTGGQVGWQNANTERKQTLDAESYRCVVVMGIQSAHAGPIFGAGAIGVAQRVLWTPTTGRDVPDLDAGQTLPEWPGTLDLDADILRPIGQDRVVLWVDPGVQREIDLAHNRRTRRVVTIDPLDAHADFNRLRLAALLGLIHGQHRVTPEGWGLAGMIGDLSRATRGNVQQAIADAKGQMNEAAGQGDEVRRLSAARAYAQRVDKAATALHRGVALHANPEREGTSVNRKHLPGEPCTHRCIAFHLRSWHGLDRAHVVDRAETLAWLEPAGDGWVLGPSRPA